MGILHAVDAATGDVAWTFKTGSEIKSSPVVVGDRVLIGSYDATLYCLSAKNGELLWKFETESYVHATPAVVDGLVYVAGCDEIFRAIRLEDGKEVFFHRSGLNAADYDVLSEGDSVEYVVQEGPRGARAENVRQATVAPS